MSLRSDLERQYPLMAQIPIIFEPFLLGVEEQQRRAGRCYDRVEIIYGVATRSGIPGYYLEFYSAPKGEMGLVDSLVLTGDELDELAESIRAIREPHRGQAEAKEGERHA